VLTPHRLMNLNYSVINIVSLVIDFLTKNDSASIKTILEFTQKTYTESNEQDILYAVSFLYLLDRVSYCRESDLVCLVVGYE